jgi:methyltransferase-like protein
MELEQYLDFLSNRTFRRTLLCHKEVELDRQITPDQITDFYLTSLAAPLKPDEDDPNPGVERFQAPDHATFSTDHPLIRAGMHYLIETSPRPISFQDLLTEVCARQGIDTPPDEYTPILAAGILRAFTYSPLLVELHLHPSQFTVEISERPLASPLARLQALTSGTITNLRHESLKVEGVTHFLLPHLDGTHDRAGLLELMVQLAEEGKIVPVADDETHSDERALKAELDQELDETLRGMARAALLIG